MGWRLSLYIMRRPLTSSQEILGNSLPNLVFSICRVRKETGNCYFHDPNPKGTRQLGIRFIEMHYFFKIFFSVPGHISDKLNI